MHHLHARESMVRSFRFFFCYNRSFRIEDPPMDWKFSAAVGDVTNFSQIWRSKPSIQSFVLCISTTSNLENQFAWLYIVGTIRCLDPQTKDQNQDPTHLYFGLEDHKLHSTPIQRTWENRLIQFLALRDYSWTLKMWKSHSWLLPCFVLFVSTQFLHVC